MRIALIVLISVVIELHFGREKLEGIIGRGRVEYLVLVAAIIIAIMQDIGELTRK